MAISVKKLDEKDKVGTYLIKGVSPAFMNAIRRTIMLHTPCLAVEDVAIYENGSVMFDEFLAHRLGMLPIKTDSRTYKQGDKVKMVLEKEGPCTVYSKDIKSTDPKIEVMDKNIPITKLNKGQRLRIEMQAIMNRGKEHAKWHPAVAGYREVPELVVSKDCDECKECVKVCPANILQLKGKKVSLTKPEECNLCGACVDACPKESIRLDFDNRSFIFITEPIAGLTTKEVIGSAIKELLGKSKQIAKALQKAK
jgi:DNA-directed RNA polymerase subunit D